MAKETKNKKSETKEEVKETKPKKNNHLKLRRIITNKYLVSTILLTINFYIIEMYLRLVTDSPFNDFSVVRIFLSCLILSMSISWITHFFKRNIVRTINTILIIAYGIYAFIELVLYNLIGFYMGMGNADQGTKVGEFVQSTLKTLNLKLTSILLVTLVLAIIYVLTDKHISKIAPRQRKRKFIYKLFINIIPLIIIGLLSFIYYQTIIDKKYQSELQATSNYSLWLLPENSNLTVNNYGIFMYIVIDIKNQITGITIEDIMLLEASDTSNIKDEEEEVPPDYTRTIDDTAWKTLMDNTSNSTYNAVNNYLINRSITPKNEYTGMFKDKNLIIILMESVNEISIYNSEYFPTLSKMYNEGISFKNNYSPRNNCSTGNNEMTVLTSLWTINNTCTTNSYRSNKYYQASFNMFKNAGYKTAAFHDYTQKFYLRGTILPNMGAETYYGVEKLGIPYSQSYTEADDKDMFIAAKDYYMSDSPFMVYFASVTPHQSYISSQTCSDRYFSKYKSLGYSDQLSRYLSKMQVFDEALNELLTELDKEGILDDTVIALFGDHFPYGLTDNDINDFFNKNNAGYTISRNSTTNKNVDKTPLIIYNSALESPIQVTDYTTIIDLLPTLLNLFDLDYDPRLYLGTDALSSTHVSRAYFSDKSWIDEVGFYYAPTNKMTYYGDKKYDAATIGAINKEISTRQTMSATAIQNNYFKYLGEGLEKYKPVEAPEEVAN